MSERFYCNEPDHPRRRLLTQAEVTAVTGTRAITTSRSRSRHVTSTNCTGCGTKFAIPVVYYSQLMSVVCGGSAKQAGLDGHIIKPKKLQDIAGK